MIDADRPGCPSCRRNLIQRLRGEPHRAPEWGDRTPVRHWGAGAGAIAAYVSIAAALAGTALSVYGQYQAGQQAAAQTYAIANYNASIAAQQGAYQQQLALFQAAMLERQAMGETALAEQQAAFVEQQGAAQSQAGIDAAVAAGRVREAGIQRAYTSTQSDVRAAIGRSGVDTTGSPLMVLLENADTVGQELALNDYNTALDVAGAKVGASSAAASAYFTRQGAALRADALSQQASYVRYGGLAALGGAQAQANLYRFQGGQSASAIRTSSLYNTGKTLLGGIGDIGLGFLRYGGSANTPVSPSLA